MKKDFQRWHNRKEKINDIEKPPFFHEREIWFCYLGANIGFEQDGIGEDFLRPILIVRKFNTRMFWGVPLTKAKIDYKENRKILKYYYLFSFIDGLQSVAILSQMRLVDSKRLAKRIGIMAENEFTGLTEKLKSLFP